MRPALSPLLLLLAVAVAALSCAPTLAGKLSPNPCHRRQEELGNGVTCKSVTLPPGLCKKCRLKPPRPDGNFTNCRSTYFVKRKGCLKKLRKYAKLNAKCDPVRRTQVKNIRKFPNYEYDLDYFVYSVCENCCDCIPFDTRRSQVGKLDLSRGNCPAHANADICKVLPKVGHFRLSTGPRAPPARKIKPVCGDLNAWRNSAAGQNWENRRVSYNRKIAAFLKTLVKATQCRKSSIWTRCWDLENTQKRI